MRLDRIHRCDVKTKPRQIRLDLTGLDFCNPRTSCNQQFPAIARHAYALASAFGAAGAGAASFEGAAGGAGAGAFSSYGGGAGASSTFPPAAGAAAGACPPLQLGGAGWLHAGAGRQQLLPPSEGRLSFGSFSPENNPPPLLQHVRTGLQHFGAGAGLQHFGAGAGLQHFGAVLQHDEPELPKNRKPASAWAPVSANAAIAAQRVAVRRIRFLLVCWSLPV